MRDRDFEQWANDLEVIIPPEFFPPGYSLRVCNALLSPEEQRAILEATYFQVNGFIAEAEFARERGGYGYVDRRQDRVSRGLPDTLP